MAVSLEGVILCIYSLVMVLMCPYTKVEESFNLQAIHDLLFTRTDINKYDHIEFPGVVPRTFLGPLLVSGLSSPFVSLNYFVGGDKLIAQYIVRSVLSLMVMCCFISYVSAVRIKCGPLVSRFLCLITMSQFHFLFYSSRPLPNVFALALVLLSLRCWLLQHTAMFLWLSGTAILIFRFELSILFGLILLLELVSGRLKISSFLYHVVPASVLLLGLTVFVDSYFWQKWMWPEGTVLWYNTILNKSSNWGTSPLWWYFTSALPRSLSLSIFFLPWGCYSDYWRSLPLLFPPLGFVCLYSLLPHKELRFIIYAIPLFNTIAAIGHAQIWRSKWKLSSFLFPFLSLSSLLISWMGSLLFLYISVHNYPGGHALYSLHQLANANSPVSVHIGVEAAMTGVSRFGEINSLWNYSKTEGLDTRILTLSYDYLIVSSKDYSLHYTDTHQLVHTERGFSSVQFTVKEFPPLNIVQVDKISVLKKKRTENT